MLRHLLLGISLIASTAHAGEDVVMTVAGVFPTPDGGTLVILSDEAEERIVPIGVGGTEGLTIAHRAQRRRFERPLTHDVLDEVLEHLGGEVTSVRIDDLQNDVFVARVVLEHGKKRKRESHTLDTRASDAIAIALGHGLDIVVAGHVVDQAAIDADEFLGGGPEPAPAEEVPDTF